MTRKALTLDTAKASYVRASTTSPIEQREFDQIVQCIEMIG